MKSFIKKNIFNSLVLLSGTLLIFTGCEKSFLKADPLSFYEPEQTYSTESGLKSVLAIADRQLKRYYTTGGDDLFPLVYTHRASRNTCSCESLPNSGIRQVFLH